MLAERDSYGKQEQNKSLLSNVIEANIMNMIATILFPVFSILSIAIIIFAVRFVVQKLK